MKKFIVTGCNGYIGSHMCYELRKQFPDCKITGIDIVDKPKLHRLYDRYVQMDLCDGLWDFYDETFDAVFHFAAFTSVGESEEYPYAYYSNNLLSSILTLQAAIDLNIKNFIFSSSCSVYGNTFVPVNESMTKKPYSVYAQTKSVFEDVLMAAEKEGKINAAILRYFNAAGRNREADLYEEHSPETHLIPNLMKTDTPTIFGDGNDVRDYIHVVDLCQAHIHAYRKLSENGKGFVCNIGTGKGYSANELVKLVGKVTGKEMKPVYTARRRGDATFLVSNTEKMTKDLKFLPKYDIVDIIKSM